MNLRLDWATHAAAKYACENWHYSRRMPRSKLAKIGVWEEGKFIGIVIFGLGSTPMMGRTEGLPKNQTCELVRVALRNQHKTPTSRIISIALRLLKKTMPGIKLVISFADTAQGHHGGIYQAGGWIFVGGKEEANGAYRINGKIMHPRSLHHKYGKGGQSIPWLRANIDPCAIRIKTPIKYKYLMPLDDLTRVKCEKFRKPYPKRAGSKVNVAAADQAAEGGAIPTPALQGSIDG